MYGPAGERRLVELVLDWLPGYAGSSPVRIGNDATRQAQLDVYGEVLDTFHQARRHGVPPEQHAWSVQLRLLEYLESAWRQPDQGIWEVRGPPRHFTHSKVMCWVALDRAIRAVDDFGLQGPDDRWRRLRREIQEEVLDRGYDAELGSFVQFYGSKRLDASLLTIPLVGFLPPDDPRVQATLAAVRRELERDGLLMRYAHDDGASEVDGLPAGEGAFLLCTFWLADDLALAGRYDEARAVFESLLALRNDLGLLSEQYDPHERRMLGNFPQAFSHIGLVTTALNLARADEEHGPAHRRGE
jgi:GH15 family glucan-1,4-alpha-glucosidase